MTPDAFRRLALSFPDTSEGAHMDHPDFRVGTGAKGGRIFATLYGEDEQSGMVKLSPKEQAELIAAHPKAFEPVKGGWGRQGCTTVHLKAANSATVRPAMAAAWRHAAAKMPAAPRRGKK
jgi:hypothetical protein